MPRVTCPKCKQLEAILKSGIVRNKQRYYCKTCQYHFTIHHEKRRTGIQKQDGHRPTSLKDIANAMGVSVSTVSRALKNHPDISPATIAAVRKLANDLYYEPNMLAQSLVTKTTHTIGVIIPNLETTFFSSMLSGIQHIASNAGYRVVICQSDESQQTEISHVQALMNNMIDGLLICHSLTTNTFNHVTSNLSKGIPIIQFYRVNMDVPLPKVRCEDEMGAFEVTEHLIKQGCKRIALLLGPENLFISNERFRGYKRAIDKYKVGWDDSLIAHVDFSKNTVEQTLEKWLKLNPAIDAIFSISDKSGVEIIQMLKRKHINVPEAICVAGFGNEYTGEIIEPQLTTFDVGTKRIGEAAAGMLLENIVEPDKQVNDMIMKGQLIVRGSTKKH